MVDLIEGDSMRGKGHNRVQKPSQITVQSSMKRFNGDRPRLNSFASAAGVKEIRILAIPVGGA